jgi:4-amino-4-deoxy-L-arabinose transferase-like glycosyltransferase
MPHAKAPRRRGSCFFAPWRLGVRPLCSVVFLLFFSLFLRAGALCLTSDALRADPDGYRRLAENLIERGTFGAGDVPTAYRPPLYSLLLAGCVVFGSWSATAIAALHVVLGAATVMLVYVLGQWWGLGRRGAALAALLVACDPILLRQSTQVMTETPATFFATAGLVVLTWASRRPTACRMVLAGAILGLGALCRPTLLLWTIAVVVVWTSQSFVANSHSRRLTAAGGILHRFHSLAVFVLGAALVLAPWAVRNQIQFGRPIVTTTHGGYTLLLGNDPSFYQWLHTGRWGDVWRADQFGADWERRRPRSELQADRQAYAEALQTIRNEPGTFCYACAVRLGRFWSPLPHRLSDDETPGRRLARWAVALWYGVVFLLAALGGGRWAVGSRQSAVGGGQSAVGSAKPQAASFSPTPPLPLSPSSARRAGKLYAMLLVVCVMVPHIVYWTDMRMRAPIMPVVALAAAAGCFRRRSPLPLGENCQESHLPSGEGHGKGRR